MSSSWQLTMKLSLSFLTKMKCTGQPRWNRTFLVWGVPRWGWAPLLLALQFGPLKATDIKPAHGFVLSLQKQPLKKMAKISFCIYYLNSRAKLNKKSVQITSKITKLLFWHFCCFLAFFVTLALLVPLWWFFCHFQSFVTYNVQKKSWEPLRGKNLLSEISKKLRLLQKKSKPLKKINCVLIMLILDNQIGIIPNLASQPLIYISIYLIFLNLIFNLEYLEV